jgi:hypothetical protein
VHARGAEEEKRIDANSKAASITLTRIRRMSDSKSARSVVFAMMPPTLAAATMTYWGAVSA